MIGDNDEPHPFQYAEAPFYPCKYGSSSFPTGANLDNAVVSTILPAAPCYDVHNNHLTLFIPPLDPDPVSWSGLPLATTEAPQGYDVDALQQSSEINARQGSSPSNASSQLIYVLSFHCERSNDNFLSVAYTPSFHPFHSGLFLLSSACNAIKGHTSLLQT